MSLGEAFFFIDSPARIGCNFAPEHSRTVAELEKGIWVKLSGKVERKLFGSIFDIEIRSCAVLEEASIEEALADVPVAKVNDKVYSVGDLIKRISLIRATIGGSHLGTAPTDVLSGMVEAELIRQKAGSVGVVVTDEDVENALRARFHPGVGEDKDSQAAYPERYQAFLSESEITDEEYRVLVTDEVQRVALRGALGTNIPKRSVHVIIGWILIPHDIPDPKNPPPKPADVIERLRTDEFASVARDVGGGSGYQGWVPKGAYPHLDDALFGPRPLAVGEVSEPIAGEYFTYIVTVLDGPQVREIDDDWVFGLAEQALQDWIDDRRVSGLREGWIELYPNTGEYRWAASKYAAPRVGETIHDEGYFAERFPNVSEWQWIYDR